MPLIENHPFSALSQQIDLLLWGSVSLCIAIPLVSLLNLGRLSLFAAPALALLTAAHNGALLIHTQRDRADAAASAGTLALPARRGSIALCWALAALWVLVGALVTVMATLVAVMGQFRGLQALVGYVELPMVVLEAGVLVVLALKCAKQRRASIIKPESINWGGMGGGA